MKPIDLSFKNPYIALKEYEGHDLSYGEICEILGQDKIHGSVMQTQIRKWFMYVDIKKVGRKYHINKVYTEQDKLTLIESHGAFSTYFQQYLINLFWEHTKKGGGCKIVLTNKDILTGFLLTEKYFAYLNTPYLFAYRDYNLTKDKTYNRTDKELTQLFRDVIRDTNRLLDKTYPIFKQIIRNSIRSLKGRRIVNVNETYKLYKNKIVNDNFILDTKGHECTVDEVSRIIECENRAMQQFNNSKTINGANVRPIKYIWQIHTEDRAKWEKDLLKEKINEQILEEFKDEGYTSRARAYEFIFVPEEMLEECAIRYNKDPLFYNVKNRCQKAINNVTRGVEEQFYDICLQHEKQ